VRPQGQIQERAAAQSELRALELDPYRLMVKPLRPYAGSAPRPGIVGGGQLAVVVMAHQDKAVPLFQKGNGPGQGIQSPENRDTAVGCQECGQAAASPTSTSFSRGVMVQRSPVRKFNNRATSGANPAQAEVAGISTRNSRVQASA